MNAPIPVKDALKLLSMAIEDCDKATPGPWLPDEIGFDEGVPNITDHEGGKLFDVRGWGMLASRFGRESEEALAIHRANMRFPVLARATMRPMLEVVKQAIAPLNPTWVVGETGDAYPPLAALMAHYDATRPDWRTR